MCPILLLFASIITISLSIDDKTSFLAQSSLFPSSCDYLIYCVLKIGTYVIIWLPGHITKFMYNLVCSYFTLP